MNEIIRIAGVAQALLAVTVTVLSGLIFQFGHLL